MWIVALVCVAAVLLLLIVTMRTQLAVALLRLGFVERLMCHFASSTLLRPAVPPLSYTNPEMARRFRLHVGPEAACERVMRLGNPDDGGWWVCGDEKLLRGPADCVIFSVGSSNEFSFERAASRGLGCKIHVFDHTSISSKSVLEGYPLVQLYPLGLGPEGATTPPIVSLTELIRASGGVVPDVLKVDIESSEWPFLESLIKAYPDGVLPGIRQVCFELHFAHGPGGTYEQQFKEGEENMGRWVKFVDHFGLVPWAVEENRLHAFFIIVQHTLVRCCTNICLMNKKIATS